VNSDDDKLGTLKQLLAPNVTEADHEFPVYGLGQPTMTGIREFVQKLSDRGQKVSHVFVIAQNDSNNRELLKLSRVSGESKNFERG